MGHFLYLLIVGEIISKDDPGLYGVLYVFKALDARKI